MSSRFVSPQLNILPISQGDTLTVKRRLNRGEQSEMFARMRAADGTIDRVKVGLETVLAFLMDWSLTDDAGAIVPYRDLDAEGRAHVLNSLDPDDFTEIREAIEDHVAAVAAAREAEKKTQAGATGSSATSPSPAGAAGVTNGSPSLTPTSTTSSSPSSPDSTPIVMGS